MTVLSRGRRKKTHAGKAVKDVDVVAGVEVVDGALAVDLKGVLVHLDVDSAPLYTCKAA